VYQCIINQNSLGSPGICRSCSMQRFRE